MKKVLFLLLFASLMLTAKGQMFINDNFSRVYVGYINLGIQDVASTDNGVLLGYASYLNLSDRPAFFELGAELMFAQGKEGRNKENIYMSNVPVSILYKFGNDEINIAPLAGFDLHVNAYYEINGKNYTDEISLFQGGWHVGTLFSFRKFNLSYKFTSSFNELVKSSDKTSYYHTAAVGFSF